MHGKKAYDNKGSCRALIHYLAHEAKEKGEELTFFNGSRNSISASEAGQSIDGNVKGLRKREVKFYSLVLSPYAEELKHIGNNKEKLEAFTRGTMQSYAGNFKLKNGRALNEQDLVWYATIHQGRTYKGQDEAVKSGKAKSGEGKPGLHTHVHIIISKRDQGQQISLNPQGSRDRFSIKGWQRLNEESFSTMFGYKKEHVKERAIKQNPERPEALQNRIGQKVEIINGMLSKQEALSTKDVLAIAEKRGYGQTFFYNLNRLENHLRKGQAVHQPLHLLEHNKDCKPLLAEKQSIFQSFSRVFKVLSEESLEKTEDLTLTGVNAKYRKKKHPLKEVKHRGMSR
jgi:hypothetical protein